MHSVLTYIPLMSPRLLIATATKGIYPVLGGRAFGRKEYHADTGIFLGIVKGLVQFTGSLWPEGVTHIGPIERYPGDTTALFIGNILKFLGNFPIDLILHPK